MSPEEIMLKPVGEIRTAHNAPENMPIQGAMDSGSTGTVTVFSDYVDGLKDVEQFSHLILIYYFHASDDGWDLEVQPFLEEDPHGAFAIRAPRRPNPLGLTVVELEERDGIQLVVRGVDMLDQTPLLDIKPYIPDVDAHPEAKDGWISGRMSSQHVSDDRFH